MSLQDSVSAGSASHAHLESELRRELGPFSATCVVIGAIVGVGIFFTPKNVALLVGSGELALITWAIGGMLAMLGALSYAELGGLYPRTAGQYEILRDAYGASLMVNNDRIMNHNATMLLTQREG